MLYHADRKQQSVDALNCDNENIVSYIIHYHSKRKPEPGWIVDYIAL